MIFLMAAAVGITVASGSPPKCTVASGGPGGPAILLDNQPYSPMFFAGNNQFGRDDVLLEEVQLAGAQGISLISFNLGLPWGQTDDEAATVVAKFCDAYPATYFYLRIWVGPPQTWLEDHPEAQITTADGTRLMMASPSSGAWLDAASAQLAARIKQVARGPYGNRLIGAMPTNLQTGEWFYPDTNNYWDYSDANRQAFRIWLKAKYRRAKALQHAWDDPSATFETAAIPVPEERESASLGPFREPSTDRQAADYTEFQSDSIVNAIETCCRIIKKATRNRALAGAFYGYTFELNHNGPRALAHSGHLALGKLLESPYIDLIQAPYAYFERGLGMPGHFHLPVDSIALHHKLAIMEEDSYTHLAEEPSSDLIAPGWYQRTQSMAETLALNRRNVGNFLTHRAGFWWFDLLSDGRWSSSELWEQAGMLRRIAAKVRDTPLFEPQIAFLVDESGVASMADTTAPYLLESIAEWRSELGRIGAPVGYYLQSDLELLPRSVRLLVLANPYALTPDQERELQQRMADGATVVWTFAPGIVQEDGLAPERISELSGIEIGSSETTGPVNFESTQTSETWNIPETWSLRFEVTDDKAMPIARYAERDAVAAAEVSVGQGYSVYTAIPRLPTGLLQRLAARAGVHLYRPDGGMVGVAGDYLFVHTDQAAKVTLCWPEPKGTAVRLVPHGIRELAVGEEGCWQDDLPATSTAIYRMDSGKPLRTTILGHFPLANE